MPEEQDKIIVASKTGDLDFLKSSPIDQVQKACCKIGCNPLHWAAGSNQLDTVEYLLSNQIFPNVDVIVETKLAKGRTALQYACRNGHLSMVEMLVTRFGANAKSKAKQGVTAFQLAIWQNHLHVCRYLVEKCGVIANEEINDFGCGAVHWLGIVPFHRANCNASKGKRSPDTIGNGQDNKTKEGDALLPLAKWLFSQPGIDVHSKQNQCHNVLHKASWGGHLALVRYLHETYNMYDDCTDNAGNYAADLADMANTERHAEIALYLRSECSLERLESFKTLGIDVGASKEEIRSAYLDQAKVFHPDAKMKRGEISSTDNDENHDFDKIRVAFEHLTIDGGISKKQKNPAHSINLLLEMQASIPSKQQSSNHSLSENDNDLFKARIIAVLLEYGDKGLNLSNIPKKWDQVWPDVPFESLFNGEKRKPGELLKLIKSRAGDVVSIVRTTKKGAILVVPKNLSRDDVLNYAAKKDLI